MYYFTADEHHFHDNIIKYCNRPFKDVFEMIDTIINNHNSMVTENDVTVHLGDFIFGSRKDAQEIIYKLNGSHMFLMGSHDKWNKNLPFLWEKRFNSDYIVACHYPMRSWPRSFYGSWQLFGHSHGRVKPVGKQHDVGVDNNNFMPVSFDQIKEIMSNREDNID